MKTLRIILLLVFCLALAACKGRGEPAPVGPDANPDAVPDLNGKYVVNGFDPLGTEYSGHLTITAGETRGIYQMQWIVVGSVQEGQGLLVGNQLQVTWQTVAASYRQSSGTASYTVTVHGELYGSRFVDGYPNPGTETAYPNQ